PLCVWQEIHVIGHIRRFAIIAHCSLSVKLEIADVVTSITEISASLYRYSYIYGLTISHILWNRHYLSLNLVILPDVEVVCFTRGQHHGADQHRQEHEHCLQM